MFCAEGFDKTEGEYLLISRRGRGRYDLVISLRRIRLGFENLSNGFKKLTILLVIALVIANLVVVWLGERQWSTRAKEQLHEAKQLPVVSVESSSLPQPLKQSVPNDATAKAVRVLQDSKVIQTPKFWLENAKQGQIIKGEYAALLVQKAAGKIQQK
jgi:hypothetical protein